MLGMPTQASDSTKETFVKSEYRNDSCLAVDAKYEEGVTYYQVSPAENSEASRRGKYEDPSTLLVYLVPFLHE